MSVQRSTMYLNSAAKKIALLLVLLLALVLRVSGLGWALPDGTLPQHSSSNVGDENAILRDTLVVLHTLQGSPELLTSHKYYMQEGWVGHSARLVVLGVAYLTGYIRFGNFDDSADGRDLLNFRHVFLVSRLVSVVAALGTVLLAYEMGNRWWGTWQGIIAALMLAIAPGHVVLSHFAKSNPLAALLSTASLCLTMMWYGRPSHRLAFLVGFCTGLAGGARANAVLSGAAFAFALLARWRDTTRPFRLSCFGVAVAGGLVALSLSYPHLVVNPRLPSYGVGSIWSNPGFDWSAFGISLWHVAGGWPGTLLITAGVILGSVRAWRCKDGRYSIGLMWSAFYCLLIAKTAIPQPRYFIPVLPTLALLAAIGITWGVGNIRPLLLSRVFCAAVLVAGFLTLAFAFSYVRIFVAEDTKITASRWLSVNAPVDATVGIPAWEGDHRVRIDTAVHSFIYSLPHPTHPDLAILGAEGIPEPDVIVVPDDQGSRNHFDMVEYELVETIHRPLVAFGLEFNDRFSESYLYVARWHDKYHATIYIYRRCD